GVVEEVTVDRHPDRAQVAAEGVRPTHLAAPQVLEVLIRLVRAGERVDVLDVGLPLFRGQTRSLALPGDVAGGKEADRQEKCESAHADWTSVLFFARRCLRGTGSSRGRGSDAAPVPAPGASSGAGT